MLDARFSGFMEFVGIANVAFMDGHVESVSVTGGGNMNSPSYWPQSAKDLQQKKKIGYLTFQSGGDDLQGPSYRPQ